MQVTFSCPKCETPVRSTLDAEGNSLRCPACEVAIECPSDAVSDGRLHRCLVCPCRELFLRKDFPQRLGVSIVVVGFVASCVAWYFYQVLLTFVILFATAAIDVVLYVAVGEVLTCYRCGAMYRGVDDLKNHRPFDLETHERFRQQAARIKS